MQHITNTGINQFVTSTNYITTALTPYTISANDYNTFVKNIQVPINPYIIKSEDNKMFNEFTVDYLRSIQSGFCSASFRITKVEMLAKNKVESENC